MDKELSGMFVVPKEEWKSHPHIEGAVEWNTTINSKISSLFDEYESLSEDVSKGSKTAYRRARRILKEISSLCIERRKELLSSFTSYRLNC